MDLDETIKNLATKVELKAEQDKTMKLQTYHSSLFIVQSYFINDESQNFLIFQPNLNIFTIYGNLKRCKNKEKIRSCTTSNNALSPKLDGIIQK